MSDDDKQEAARARLEFVESVHTLVQVGRTATAAMRESGIEVHVQCVDAVSSDGARILVRKLRTVLGVVDAAVLNAEDLVSLVVDLNDIDKATPAVEDLT